MEYRNAVHLKDNPKGNITSLWPLLRYLKPYRLQVFGASVALLFTSAAVLCLGRGLQFMVDRGIGGKNPEVLDFTFLALLGLVLLLAGATYVRYYLVSQVGELTIANMRKDLFAHLLRLDMPFFEHQRSGELMSRISTDTSLIQSIFGSAVSVALRNILIFVGGLGLLIYTNPHLTAYVLGMLPFVVAPILMLGRRVRKLSRETQDSMGNMNALSGERLGAIRMIKAMALEDESIGAYNMHVDAANEMAVSRIRVRALLTGMVILLVFGAVALVLWVGGKSVMSGTMSAGELSSFVFYAVLVAAALGALSEVVGDLQRAAGAAERLQEIFLHQPSIITPTPHLPIPDLKSTVLRFDHVGFTYPARPELAALHDITLNLIPGQTTALVGPSGGGKSTILSLLLRLYDPSQGRILIGETELTRIDAQAWRSAIGLVPQDPVLFGGTAYDNIRIARPSASDAEIEDAATRAHAFNFLSKLPKGLHTQIGERGAQLSGGQRQRIAIARAILRAPQLLLLDEATSALDAKSEHAVQEALKHLMQDRTTLVIAHRLSTVIRADRIVFLNEGRIEAIGTHAELLKQNEHYAKLCSLQLLSV